MSTIDISSLSKLIIQKRGTKGMREISNSIGISPATLSRVERGRIPDLQTFAKICNWLKIEPSDIRGLETDRDTSVNAAVKFRKNDTIDKELAQSLANMIILTQKALCT